MSMCVGWEEGSASVFEAMEPQMYPTLMYVILTNVQRGPASSLKSLT